MAVSFNELFNKAKEVAIAAGKVAGEVVDEVVDSSKSKFAEVKIKSQIAEITERLGAVVYETATRGTDTQKLQAMLIAKLDALYKELDAFSKEKAATEPNHVEAELVCGSCGAKNVAHAVFCSACGSKLARDIVPLETAVADSATETSAEIIE